MDSGNVVSDVFKLWGIAFIIAVSAGTVITIFAHAPILGVLPQNEWSPIIAWILSAVVGYVAASVAGAAVTLGVFGAAAS